MTFKDSLTNNIFQKSWWLEAVAPGQWSYIEIEKGGEIFARMPIVTQKKFGQTICSMPKFTQVLGPWIKQLPGKEASQLSKQKELFTELIKRIPTNIYFKQRFHYSITNWLPFYWNNFEQTTRYTYVLEDISDTDVIWKEMQGNIRREIKKARKNIVTELSEDIKIMWDLHCNNFQNNNPPEGSISDFERLYTICKENNAGQILLARNSDNTIVSGVFVVWDENSAYYIFGGTLDHFKNTGAFSLLMFDTISFLSDKTPSFDFEGSMIESIERFYRGFGASQKPYFHITKTNKIINTVRALLS